MLKKLVIALVGFISMIYLVNPSAGLIELIPDNFPLVGNLDEAAAATLFLAALRHFGVDLTALFTKKDKKNDPIDLKEDEFKDKEK